MVFLFSYSIWLYIPCKNLHSLAKASQTIAQAYKNFLHLEIPTNYQYLTGTINVIPTGRLFDTNVDVDY